MATEIVLPKFGQQTETSTIIKWHKREGETVAKGDVLLEIQTDKAALEVESFFSGTLLKVYAKEGDELPVMSVIGYIGELGERVPEAPPVPKASAAGPKPAITSVAPHAAAAAAQARFSITPRARHLAEEALVDPTRIPGTGDHGMVTERDLVAYLAAHKHDQVVVSPTAAELIRQHKLHLFDIGGTGEGGRITKEDIERALAERPKPLSAMRRIISKRMTQSVTTAPHYSITVRTDMTDLLEFRKEARREHGLKASVGDFITKAAGLTLREMPVVNSVCLGDTHRVNKQVNVGIAVALDEGLLVPVIRNADTRSLEEIAAASKDLAARARDKKLMPDELTGGTFSISNMGMLGVNQFTAIINPGESAILALGEAVETPIVKAGQIVIRTLMNMTLSSDHRVIDGAVAAQFMNKLRDKLQNVALWKQLCTAG